MATEKEMIEMLKARRSEAHTLWKSYRHKDSKRAAVWLRASELLADAVEAVEALEC